MTSLARVAALGAVVSFAAAQSFPTPPRLLADLNTDPREIRSSYPGGFCAAGPVAYFTADDGVHGRELWRSLGTTTSTVLVADLRPGAEGSEPRMVTALGSGAVFFANDGSNGLLPYATGGTPGDARALIAPGSGALRSVLAAESVGPRALFFADDGVHGVELWSTDGTLAGTVVLRGLVPAAATLTPLANWMRTVRPEADGTTSLVFAIVAGSSFVLHRSDGTAAGTRILAQIPHPAGTAIGPACTLPGGPTLFTRMTAPSAAPTWSIWSTDGTASGTRLVVDLPYAIDPFVRPIVFDGRAWFGGDIGRYAVSTDGTATGTRSHQVVGSTRRRVGRFCGVVDDALWCHHASSTELVRFGAGALDGTRYPITGVQISPSPYDEAPVFQLGSRLLLVNGMDQLWSIDVRTASATRLGNSNPVPFAARAILGSRALLALITPLGCELGVTDGSPAGTALVANIRDENWLAPNSPSYVSQYGTFRGRAFFAPIETGNRRRAWASDGTSAGTIPLFAALPPTRGSAESSAGLFFAGDVNLATRLCFSDGTEAGTRVVPPATPGSDPRWVDDIVVLGSRAVFRAVDGITAGLFASDGLSTWPLPVAWPAGLGEVVASALGERVIVRVLLPTNDPAVWSCAIWTTDGSAAGTTLATTIATRAGVLRQVVFADRIWFGAFESPGQEVLWESDGSAEGTMPHRRGMPRPPAGPFDVDVAGVQLFVIGANQIWVADGRGRYEFVANVPCPGGAASVGIGERLVIGPWGTSVLWCTDGSPAGTRVFPAIGRRYPDDQFLTLGARRALFSGVQAGGYPQPWVTDGTPGGTSRFATLTTWSRGRLVGGRAFLTLEDPVAGFEPHVVDPGASVEVVLPGCGGPRAPDLVALDDPVLGSTMRLRGRSSQGAIAILMLSLVPSTPLAPLSQSPCSFAVDPSAFAAATPIPLVDQGFSLVVPVPGDPVLRDAAVVVQFAAGPTDATLGADLSTGLRLQLGW